MRVAIFSDTYVPEINGVAKTLKRLTDYFDQHNIEYKLFVPENRSSVPDISDVERLASIPFLLYPQCRLAFPNTAHLKKSLHDFSPDLIHIATPFNVGLYGQYYGRKYNIPMVASYHTHFDRYLEYYNLSLLINWLWRYMEWFHRPFEKVYVPSESTKDKLTELNIHPNIDIWGRGVNHQFFSPSKRTVKVREKYKIKEKYILLYVGRVSAEKDVDVALDAFHSLSPEIYDQTHLMIVGDGPLLAHMKKSNNEKITFAGFLKGSDLAEVYASSDVFLFPSSTETFGNVVLEAASSGLPVIGADAGGIQHLVKQNVTGYLCAPKDKGSFVEQTEKLLVNDDLRKQMGYQARQFALTQSWDEILSELVMGYERVLTKKVQALA
ncbi:glycosyltransferase family 4 protein [Salipaludibacillus sp. HK11]|uniref:glycosyltransferase family 4 protein n=1 Tax=Salipaludibacillus sp. HK11 TaxID=3394320 RepID=UPI0039FC7892